MPNRLYSKKKPPTPLEHFLAHPWSVCIGVWAVMMGLLLAGEGVADFLPFGEVAHIVSPSMDEIPALLAMAVGLAMAGGHAVAVLGIMDSDPDLTRGWRRERIGIAFAGAAWLSYGVAVAWQFPSSALSWSSAVAITLALLGRLAGTIIEERRARAAIMEVR